jgi:hypothetical protein
MAGVSSLCSWRPAATLPDRGRAAERIGHAGDGDEAFGDRDRRMIGR